MRLVRLTGLERDKLAEELRALREEITRLTALVEDETSRRGFLREEIRDLAHLYNDPRRTEILDGDGEFRLSKGGGGEAQLVLVSRGGYVKAQPAATGGGMAGAEVLSTREGDFARHAFLARGTHTLLAVTARGNAHALPVSALPRGTRSSRGRHLEEFIELEPGDEIVALLAVEMFADDRFLVVATRRGHVKRSALSGYANARSAGIIAAGLARGDEIAAAFVTEGSSDLLFATRSGQAIRFPESAIRTMGRTARGVKAIELASGDVVVAAAAPRADSDLLVATSAGYGKRIPFTEFKVQGRAGKGFTILPERARTGGLVGFAEAHDADELAWELSDGSVEATSAASVIRRSPREAGRPAVRLPAGVAVGAVHPMHSGRRVRTGPPSHGEAGEDAFRELPSGGKDSQAQLEFEA